MADAARKATAAIIKDLRAQGYVVEKNAKSHWRVTHPDRDGLVFLPSTPSEYRSIKNSLGKLRRHIGYHPSRHIRA